MNLQEFIDLRSHCPMCGTSLITNFISDRKQKNRFENDKYVAKLVMRGMRSCEPDYEVGYHFGLRDNSLSIEFYNEWDMSASASMYMVKIFKDFHKNMANTKFKFVRSCGFCFHYEMLSGPIDINLKSSTYGDVIPFKESFIFTTQTEENNKVVLLENNIEKSSSNLYWWRDEGNVRIGWTQPFRSSKITELPLIPFISKEETNRRLNTLITFA